MLKKLLIFFLFFSFHQINAQNTCATAVTISTLPFNSGTLTTCGTVNDYTAGSYCTNTSYGGGEDYVFKYTATVSGNHAISLAGAATWKIASVHTACPPTTGNCIGGITTSSGTTASGTVSLTSGTTYYIFIDTYPSPTCGEFILTLDSPPPPPSNDDCSGAIGLTVNPSTTCTTVTNSTTLGATQSQTACVGSGADDDVWFSFVATSTVHSIDILNVSGSTDMVHQVFSGSCGSLVSKTCSDPNSSTTSGLTIGDTYYVRVHTYSSGNSASFDICVKTPPPPPSNDECSGAIGLTVNPSTICTTITNGTTYSATQSQTACVGSGADDDVWFSFVATSTVHSIDILNVSSSTDMVHQVFSGTCGSLVSKTCSDPNSSTTSGLTIGDTYYIRVHTYSTGNSATFDICVKTPPPPPSNDECSGAIAFPTIPTDQSCASVTANTANATQSLTGCAGTADDDVWYSFVCPTGYTSLLFSNTSVSGDADRVLQFYSGSCGSLSSILCSDPENGTISGLVGGQTYYMRVYTYYSNVSTQVTVCLKTPPPPPKTWVGGTGDWGVASNWSPSGIPTCTDSVNISAGTITLNGASAECKGLIISSGTLNLNSGSLTIGVCGATDGGARYFVQSGGTINFSGATVTLNGGFTQSSGTITISSGIFTIDPNGSSGVYSVTNSCNIAGTFNMSGGNLNLPDASSSSGTVIYYNSSTNRNFTGGTVTIGGGTSSNTLNINTYVGSGRLAFYNLDISTSTNNTYANSSAWSFGVLNNLSISSGELRSSVSLYVNGNLTNSGILTTTSTLYLSNFASGSSSASPNAQIVGGGGTYRNAITKTADFSSLTINNSNTSGVTFDITDPSVSSTLTMTAGKIFGSASGSFVLWAKGSISYTAGWVVGNLKRSISASGATFFPIGTTSVYYPVTTTFSANPAGDLTAGFYSGAPGSTGLPLTEASGTNPYLGIDSLWASGVWRLTTGNIGSTTYSIAVTATGAPSNGNTANVRVIKRADNGSVWDNPGTHVNGSGVVFTRSGLSGFSEFGIVRGSVAPLPINLSSITAKSENTVNKIYWTTESEKNTAWHQIERASNENEGFIAIGKIGAAGNSNNALSYSFIDKNPLLMSYYRLRTIDLDGKESLSSVVSVERNVEHFTVEKLYPNPTNHFLNIDLKSPKSDEYSLNIYNSVGQIVLSKKVQINKGVSTETIDISSLSNGIYQIQLNNNVNKWTQTFSKF